MQPLSGHTSDAIDFRHVVTKHMASRQTTDGTAYLVADSTLYSEENLQKLAYTGSSWIPRVSATFTEAQTALAQATPETMRPLMEGYRYGVLASTYGGVAQRWVLIYSEHRCPQAQRTADRQLLKQSANDVKAFQNLCRTAFACEADAQQALSTFVQHLQATHLHHVAIHPLPAMRSGDGRATRRFRTKWCTRSKGR
jgi:transposase